MRAQLSNKESAMRAISALIACVCFGLISGCAHDERYYGNVYEGLKTKAAMDHPLNDSSSSGNSLTYQEYNSERQKLLNQKPSE
jgi:hypothetical protein